MNALLRKPYRRTLESLPAYHDEALTILELEDRFETTVAALDSARCSNNSVQAL